MWSKGDGNDTIYDTSTSLTDVDSLRLVDVASTGAVLTKVGNNLEVNITSTGETIAVTNRFYSSGRGYGTEIIAFSDGVITKVLDSPVAEAIITGTAANNTLAGWGYMDTIYGLDGNDVIDGNGGDDVIIGGLGNDTLRGDAGNDTYIWSKGDGNDTLNDTDISLTDVDTLEFTDVDSTDISLTRAHGSNHLVITIISTGEQITVTNRYNSITKGYGLEIGRAHV